MKNLWPLAFCWLAAGPISASAQTAEIPTYSNAEVISVDPARRQIVLRTAPGRTETLLFDDLLVSTGSAKAGDRVIVTVRGGPGRRRMSAIQIVPPTAAPTPQRASTPLPATVARPATDPRTGESVRTASQRAAARARYSDQVAAVSRRAEAVDGLWSTFVSSCAVRPVSNEGGGRAWFGLWDGRVYADYSGGQCRELFNQIVTAGEAIKQSMAAAETGIEDWLIPGEVRDVRTSHSMNWDGWLLPAPQRREP